MTPFRPSFCRALQRQLEPLLVVLVQAPTIFTLLLALILAFGLVLPIPGLGARSAQAFELFGITFFGGRDGDEADTVIGDPVPYTVQFTITGEDAAAAFDGYDVRAASALWRGREEPASGVAGLLADARGDYRRLLGALYVQGFYGSSLSITVNGEEAANLPPDHEVTRPVAVAISVDPGPLYRFGRVEVIGDASVPAGQEDGFETPQSLGLMAGAPALSGIIFASERAAVAAWRRRGHALAEAAERSVEADHRTREVDVTIVIKPGPVAHYGPLRVEGAERMEPDFLAYMADLPEGERYDPEAIERANARLAALDVFRSVRIEQGEAIGADGRLPQTLFVQERPLRRLGAGASFSSVDGAGLEAYWLHRDLFGRAERLRVEGRVSGINSTDPDDFTYRFATSFTRPGIVTPDTRLIAALEAEREVLESYTRTGASAELGLDHPFSPSLTGRFAVQGRYAQFDDGLFGERDFTSVGFQSRLTYDSRDLPTDATTGFFLEATATPYYEFGRETFGSALTGEARAYQSLMPQDRLILAARARIGTALGPSIGDTAPDRLFLAGGGGSVRGYAYRNIGVDQGGGEISGGRFLLEGSVEMRARLTEVIGAVLFADAGYVDADSVPSFEDDVRIGVGAGLRYLTPLGPLRFDVAVPLDPGEGDDDVAFYIGIGQAF